MKNGKELIFSTVGNDNYGDESMFINYLDKSSLLHSKNVEVMSTFYKRAAEQYPQHCFYNPFEGVNTNKFVKLKVFLGSIFDSSKQHVKLRLKSPIEEYSKFTMCGGGNLNSIYLGTMFDIYTITKLFKSNGKKVYFRPQSLGPFKGIKGAVCKYMLKKIIKMSDEFLVREHESYNLAVKMGLKDKIKVDIDEAWDLKVAPIEDNSLLKILNRDKIKVGISIRPWNNIENFKQHIIEFVEYLMKENKYDVYFIPIAYGGSEEYIDNGFLKKELHNREGIFFVEDFIDVKKINPQNIKWIISKMDMCMGLSYHFNVFSNSLAKPTLGLYSDKYYYIKNVGFYKLLGLEENVIQIQDYSSMEILQKFNSCKVYNENS
ncbi:hypothetical protein CPJCM30710_29100 [Clostridium polyendosporum]|uniref:Polysaccharide pyruvyl transferase domain-containing protein n=1 Tax=Clostridium polyendosporum TaxID=69208 RepID=A0A919S2G5_9CLOT|nr:polysaccharide pyruvyl transferase family protein [Clostridium polyendosporum]GIM30244.1 hypothetical protein CPJCM30710_29100 [Clostridium polyendosporum]